MDSAAFLTGHTSRLERGERVRAQGEGTEQHTAKHSFTAGIRAAIFFSAGRNLLVLKCSSSASPNVHKYDASVLQRANVREVFWAEVKARTVPFLRGFPLFRRWAEVEMPMGARKRQRASRSPAVPSARTRAKPKGGRRYGRKEALGKSPSFPHPAQSLCWFPRAERQLNPTASKCKR